MEVAGLVFGIAGIFSVCVDVLDKVQSYRDSEAASDQLVVRFKIEKFRLYEWANSVGFKGNDILDDHHPRLDNVAVRSIIYQVICGIINLFANAQEVLDELEGIKPVKRVKSIKDESSLAATSFAATQPISGSTGDTRKLSKTAKLKWTFRSEKRFTTQVETLSILTDKLYDLVPPESRSKLQDGAETGQADFAGQDVKLFSQFHEDLHALLASNRQKATIEERRLIQDVLKPPSVSDDLPSNLLKCLDGTCKWVFDLPAFTEWAAEIDTTTTTSKLLWLCGSAGTGKSILSAQIVSWLQKQPNTHCFYFFCSPHAQSRGHLDDIIRVWLCEIVQVDQESLDLAGEMILSQPKVKIANQDVWTVFSAVVTQLANCVFVIDGLDEYDKSKISRQDFLATMKVHLAATSSRILITSRDEVDLRAELIQEQSCDSSDIAISYHKITKVDTESDVGLFSQSMVRQRLAKKDAKFQDELATDLAKRCDGMFLWITLSGQCLRGGLSNTRILQTVARVPDGLLSAYKRNWELVLSQPEYERSRAIKIFVWCVFGFRTLTVTELAEALTIDLESPFDTSDMPDEIDADFVNEEIIELCSSLVEARSTEQGRPISQHTIQLVHFSVKDFLLSAIGVVSDEQPELAEDHHLELTKKCLHYLNSIPVGDEASEKDAFITYAINNWHEHLSAANTLDTYLYNAVADFLIDGRHVPEWRKIFEKSVPPIEEKATEEKVAELYKHSALYFAASLNLLPTIAILLEDDSIDVNEIGGKLGTALHAACYHGHMDVFHKLLDSGSDIFALGSETGSALHVAVSSDHLDMVKELLKRGMDVNSPNPSGLTPLILACKLGLTIISKYLIENGADVSIRAQSSDLSPLHHAAGYGHEEIVDLLLKAGAEIDSLDCLLQTPLLCALADGYPSIAKTLLSNGASPVKLDKDGSSCLHVAAQRGYLDIVQLLLKDPDHNPGIDRQNQDGITPFFIAAHHGHTEVVKLLLDHGADPSIRQNDGFQPLHHAAHEGYLGIAQAILEHYPEAALGIAENGCVPLVSAAAGGHLELLKLILPLTPQFVNAIISGLTPLHFVALKGNVEMAKLLLDNGANIRNTKEDGWTILDAAIINENLELVRLLLERGDQSFVNEKNRVGYTPLTMAATRKSVEMTRMLLEHGADINSLSDPGFSTLIEAINSEGLELVQFLLECGANMQCNYLSQSPLYYAAQHGVLNIVKLLLEHGADVHFLTNENNTVLHGACVGGDHVKTVKLLLDHGADPAKPNKYGYFSIHTAAHWGRLEILKLFVDHGIAIDAIAEGEDDTPLILAALQGNLDCVEYLLSHGANVHHLDFKGGTALHCAAQNGHSSIVNMLLDRGADVNAMNSIGSMPIHIAANTGKHAEIILLHERGSKIDGTNHENRTPLIFAASNGHPECITVLLNRGADINHIDKYSATPLIHAALTGQLEAVQALLDRGADLSIGDAHGLLQFLTIPSMDMLNILTLLIERGTNQVRSAGDTFHPMDLIEWKTCVESLVAWKKLNAEDETATATPLLIAVEAEHIEVVQQLLARDSNIKATMSPNDRNAVHIACIKGSIEIVKLLLKEEADLAERFKSERKSSTDSTIQSDVEVKPYIEIVDSLGFTALYLAAMYGHLDILQLLVAHGADINKTSKENWTPLHEACHGGHVDVVKELLDLGASLYTPNDIGWTPIHSASQTGKLEIVRFLLDNGVPADSKGPQDLQPLHVAAYHGNADIVELLIDRGAPLEVAIGVGRTPLLSAAYQGKLNVVKILLERGASVAQVAEGDTGTVLHFAAAGGFSEIASLLMDRGVSVDVLSATGYTPLHSAAFYGHAGVIQLLLDRGAEIEALTNNGETPLQLAEKANEDGAYEALLKRGAIRKQKRFIPSNAIAAPSKIEVRDAWTSMEKQKEPEPRPAVRWISPAETDYQDASTQYETQSSDKNEKGTEIPDES